MNEETERALSQHAKMQELRSRLHVGIPPMRPAHSYTLSEWGAINDIKESVARREIKQLLSEGFLRKERAHVVDTAGRTIIGTVYVVVE